MTSLLAFAWRRAQSSSTTGSSTEGSLGDTMMEQQQPQDVTVASSSSDTLPNPMSSDTLGTEMSYCLAGPSTPDALKRRKPPQEIRKELGLPPKREPFQWPEVEPKDRLSTLSSSPAVSIQSVLPPMPACMSSPQISTTSYHSRRSIEQNVARSPSLKVGEAKTAVGALLAMNESRAAVLPPFPPPPPASAHEGTSILPCRAWLQEDRSLEEANDFSIELPYEALNDSKGYCFSPASSARFRAAHHLNDDDDDDNDEDEQSSIHASPSSHRGRLARNNLPNTSFTRGFLEAKDDDPYDFHPIVDKELIVVDDDNPMNMSCMSQSTVKEMESICSMGGDTSYQKLRVQEQKFRNQNERRIKEDLLLSTLERLQDDTEIVVEVMNRLKETQAKWDLSKRLEGENLFWGFAEKQRMAILKAIDEQVSKWRSTLSNLDHVDVDLMESFAFCRSLVHASIPSNEKLIHVSGPSSAFTPQHGHRWKHVPGFRASLGFDEEPRSPQTIRGGDTSLFSLPSESGNDATPHTSNVSMTSTITSAVTPDNRANKRFGNMFAQGNLRETMETVCSALDALSAECVSLIQTNLSNKSFANIQRIYYQLLSIPNDELKAVIDSFELDIVNLNISRMVSDDQGDEGDAPRRMRSIAEPLPLVRSWGPIDNGGSQHVASQAIQSSSSSSFHPLEYHMLHSDDEGDDNHSIHNDRENQDLYSPTSQDMQTLVPSPTRSSLNTTTIDDDLRRTVGSFDTEDVMEQREGPPSMTDATNTMRNKWSKGRLSIFNRRSLRKRQAAE